MEKHSERKMQVSLTNYCSPVTTSFLDDCGYTKYNASNEKKSYIENNGIIEYNKLIINSDNLCSCGPKCYGYFFTSRTLVIDNKRKNPILNILKPKDFLYDHIHVTSSQK